MKVCILSMQKVNNMGSLLQAYGLKCMLEKFDCIVEYMDIKRIDEDYDLLGTNTQNYSNEFEKTGVVGKMFKLNKYLLNRIKHKKLEKKQDELFKEFRQDVLDISKVSDRYDVCVIGSDEVFNCLNAGTWGFTSQLFGNVPEATKVITYAASCGATKIKDLPSNVKNKIRDSFMKISAFSVRDNNTFDFVKQLARNKPIKNLDPVLIWDYSRELQNIEALKIDDNYCIVYSYKNRIHTKKEINAIKCFCEQNNLKLVSVGAPQFWIKEYVVCTPFQCLTLFKNASFVITDTFHGTIFSIKYANRFAVIVRESNRNKLGDLIDELGINAHCMHSMRDLGKIYEIEKDIEKINFTINKERISSYEYLKENIWGNEKR